MDKCKNVENKGINFQNITFAIITYFAIIFAERRNMSQITVVDSLMGTGKTSWAIEYMNQNLDENILYVSPFLDQDDRIISACRYTRDFKKPINKGGGKLKSINKLKNNI